MAAGEWLLIVVLALIPVTFIEMAKLVRLGLRVNQVKKQLTERPLTQSREKRERIT